MASSKRSAPQNPSKAKVARSDHGYGDDLSETVYRQRLLEQGKYCDLKPGSRSLDGCLKDPPALPPLAIIREKSGRDPRLDAGSLYFADFPEFRPNLTPKEVLLRGSFGGTYFRDIVSAVTGERHVGKEVIQQFPADWFAGLDLDTQVVSSVYDKNVNRFKVACGGSLGQWETSGWIAGIDPYGWFQWYCHFYLGRRSTDDERQVSRWLRGQGSKGRWRLQLAKKCVDSHARHDDVRISPVIRQTCQHWAYELTAADLAAYECS
uniref:Uncharacterized protein n=1 Tax=Noctiluca scintillans TaxID=2966 RepID=A0A7S1ASW4_NOCSC